MAGRNKRAERLTVFAEQEGLGGGNVARGPVEAVRGNRKERESPIFRGEGQGEDEPVMTYCHDVIYLCCRVDRNMREPAKVHHLLRGLKRSLVERVYPFLNPEIHISQDFMRLAQVQCQAVLLENRGVPPPTSTLATSPTALRPYANCAIQ